MGRSKLPGVLSSLVLLSMLHVVVSQTPTVIVSQSTYAAVPGDSVTLSCTATSTAAITTVLWVRDRGGSTTTITSNGGKYQGVTTTDPSLTITSLANGDTGSYRCLASTSTGTFGQSGTTYLTVATPNIAPVVQTALASYSGPAGSSVTLGCVISANPAATSVSWTKAGSSITVDGSKYLNGNTGTPSLTITGLAFADAGAYVCSATNSFGSSTSNAATLTVTGSIPVLSVTTPVTVAAGSSVTLQCSVQSANPAITSVFWLFTPTGSNTGTQITSATSGYSGATIASPSLTLQTANTGNAGSYVCNAVNAAGTGASSPISLTVTTTTTVPVLSVQQTTQTVAPGSNAVLQCSIVSANPAATNVYWTFTPNGGTQTTITIDNVNHQGSTTANPTLTVLSANNADAGAYMCHATNTAGTGNSATITLTVGNVPVLSVQQTTQTVAQGSNAVLQCSIQSANPAANNVYWTFTPNGGTLTTINIDNVNHQGSTTANPTLTVLSANTADAGTYVCHATNTVGTGNSATITLTVGNAPVLSVQQTTQTVSEGSNAVLQCNIVSASPAANNVYWTFTPNGGTQTTLNIDNVNYQGSTTANPTLTVLNANSADAGSYVCLATNTVGTGNSATIVLSVTGNVPVLSVQQTTQTVVSGNNAVLQCSIQSANPAANNVYWTFTPNGGTQTIITIDNVNHQGSTTANPTLTVLNANTADAGAYVCHAINTVGTGNSATITLTVTNVPVLSVQQTTQTVVSGNNAVLQCSIQSANPAVNNVYWTFTPNGGTPTTITIDNVNHQGSTTANPTLTVLSANSADAGSYVCLATNTVGTGNSATIVLSVTGNVPVLSVQQTTQTVVSGNNAVLQCSIQSANPAANNVYWTFTPNGGTQTIITIDNVNHQGSTTANPTLTVLNANTADAGAYVCHAINTVGTGNSATITLTVTNVPVLSVQQTTQTVVSGNNAVLQCSIQSANPAVNNVYWTFTPNGGTPTTITIDNVNHQGSTTANPTLTVLSANSADAGAYVCHAINTAGTGNSATITLTVTNVPVLSVQQTTQTVVSGNNAVLQCSIQSANPAVNNVYWTFTPNGGTPTTITIDNVNHQGSTTANPTLTVLSANSADAGAYVCHAINTAGTGNSATITLTVTNVPVLSVQQTTQTVVSGNNAVLQCSIQSANPAVNNVYWTFTPNGGTPTTITIDNVNHQGSTTANPTLTVLSANSADAGAYVCHAINTAGTGNSATITLTVGSVPSVNIPQNSYTAVQGQSFTIPCNIVANPSATSVTWQKVTNNVPQTLAISALNRLSGGTVSNPPLTISSVQTSDAGFYTCTATNVVGTVTSGLTQLIVNTVPVLTVPQTTQTVVSGSNAVLQCSIQSANPAANNVYWTFTPNGGTPTTITIDNVNHQGSTTASPTLTVLSANSADAGSYVCHAINTAGTGNSATIVLSVTGSLPLVTIQQNAYSVTTGAGVTLGCTVTASPLHTSVVWEKLVNNVYQTVSINGRFTGGSTTEPSLSISNSQPADSGTYRCKATNQVGTGTSGTTQLTVSGNVPLVQILLTTYTGVIGSQITIPCSITSDPAHTSATWRRTVNGQVTTITPANSGGKYTVGQLTSPDLTITGLQSSDAGDYTCTAVNSVGSGQDSATLTLTGNVPTVTVSQTSYTVITGSSATLQCSATGVPAVTSVFWEKTSNGQTTQITIGSGRFTLSNPSLSITSAASGDAGTYRCKAVNDVGTGQSNPVTVTVIGAVPLVNIPLTTYSAVIGGQITIPCSITSNPAHTSATWRRTVNGQVTTITPANSGGKYTVGQLTSPDLTITGLQSIPTVTIPLTGYSVQTGNSITIPCTIVATPSITGVTWRRVQGTQSTPLTINGQTFTGGSTTTPALTIPSAVKTTHEGFYVCTATNAAGVGTSGTTFLAVTGAIPTVTVPQTTATAIIGTSVTLQCVVTADPVATIVEWTKAGSTTAITITGNSKYTGGTPANPSLTIVTTENNDAGGYTCSATNAVGKGTSGQVTLTVSGNVPTVTVSQTTYTVITGSAATLQCSASGVPAVTSVSWEKVASNGQTTEITISSGRFTVSNPSLSITSAASGDAGTYRCKAANAVGTGQSNPVTVTVTGAVPSVVIGSATYTAVTGTQVTLVCTVTASPSASLIRWSKTTTSGTSFITVDGTKYQNGVPATPSLVINTVAESDAGTYVCQATNVVGTGSSGQTVLTVTGSIPNVQVTQPSYSVTKGGTITLQCTVSGLPAATSVEWKRTSGGTETTVSTTPAKYSGSTPAIPSLTITGADSIDAATYVCTATNSVGVGRSTQTSLSVTGDIPTVTVPTLTFSTISGSPVTLTCVVSASPPADSVQWKKIKNTVSTNIDVSLSTYTGSTVGNPSLTIVAAKSADIAEYICTATNSVGTGESGRVTLAVTGAVPTVSIPVASTSVITGKSVTIVCTVVSDPAASSISWSKTVGTVTSVLNIDNNKFSGGTIQTPDLTISNAAANDQASYKCTATNVVGSATSNAAVLTVTGGLPTIVIENPAITAVLGSSITIRCQVTADPTASKISWERTIGGTTTPIVINSKFVGSTVANPSLTINTIATTDQGSYVCVAENEVGVGRSAPGQVTVTGNVPSVVISKTTYTVVTGQDITIDCDYTASPAATSLKWRKIVDTQPTDVTLTGSTKYSGGTLTSPSLVIKGAVAADQAFYQCVVTNSVGDGLSTTAFLFVTGAIPTATVTQTSYNIELGKPVTISCNVAGVPAVQSVAWTVNKPPSTTSSPIVINAPKYSGGSVGTPSLTIAATTLDDQGIYTCKATNILGTGESVKVYLTVVGSSPIVSVPVSAYTVDRGGQVVLACSIVAAPAVTSVYWTRTVQGAVNHITAAAPKYEGSTPANPSLTINTLEPADQGSYRCHATNSVSTARSELTNLIVSLAPRNIQVNPDSITRREQQDFSSTCTAEANPAPTYRWVKESTQQVISTVQTLTIQNIDRGHQGKYICTASNSRGSATATLNVDIQYKPISTVPTAEQTVVVGMNDPRTLTCNTISNPSVETYRWAKNNVAIPGATGLTYVVTVTSQSDYTTYSCYATNSIGESPAINFLLQSGAVTPRPADDIPALTTEVIIAIAVALAVLLLILIIILVCCCARAPRPKVERVYTKKPALAPVSMMPPPVMMSDPSMALVPMNDSLRRPYDNGYTLRRSELPSQEYTYYESERGKKDRPASFINFSGE